MRRTLRRGLVPLSAMSIVLLGLFGLFAAPAWAQSATTSPSAPSPSPLGEGDASPSLEEAIQLASPATVFIDLSVEVKVQLVYTDASTISGLGRVSDKYRFDYATGTGFAVNPNGVVVTASHVVEPVEQEMWNYAANKLILDSFGYTYDDPFSQWRITDVGRLNTLLQQCYKGVACDFEITPYITVYSSVDIAQQTLPKGTTARVLYSTGFDATDVAVMQISTTNQPTVVLAETANNLATGDEVVSLGYPGTARDGLETGVTTPTKAFGRVSNIRTEGTSQIIEIDASVQPGMSGGPVIDDSGKVVGLNSFTLLQSTGESGSKFLRTVDDIRAALAAAGVSAEQGPADIAYANALNLYHDQHYSAAVPQFEKVLDLYPGQPVATELLAESQAKAGTAEDVPLPSATTSSDTSGGGGFPMVAVIGIIAAVVIVGGLLFAMSRRKKAPAEAAVPPAVAPVQAIATPPTQQAEAARVGFQPTPAAEPPKVEAPPPAAAPLTAAPPAEPPATPPPTPAAPQGSPQPATKGEDHAFFCPNCGHKLEPDAHFCPSCGQRIEV